MPGQHEPQPSRLRLQAAKERTQRSWAWFKNLDGVRCVRQITHGLMKRVNRSLVLGFLLWDMAVSTGMTTFYFMHDNIANLGLVSEHIVRLIGIFRLLAVVAGLAVVLRRKHRLVRLFFTSFILNWIVLGVIFLVPVVRLQCSCVDGTWEQCNAMQDFWETGLHINFKPAPEKWQVKQDGHLNKYMKVQPMPKTDQEKTDALTKLLFATSEDSRSLLERRERNEVSRLPKRLQGHKSMDHLGQSASFWAIRQSPAALLQAHTSDDIHLHGSAWNNFRIHEEDPDAGNASSSQNSTPVRCEEQIFKGKQGSSLMEEAMLQKSSSSIRNSTQFAKMLLRKSLTNQLIDKVQVTMRKVVQNLLNQPEFEAIICEYAKHHHDFHHNVSDKIGKHRKMRKLTGAMLKQGALATEEEEEQGHVPAAARTVQQGTYRLLQSELEGMPSREGMQRLSEMYKEICRCADLDSCRLSEPDAFWCYVDESTLHGCKAEGIKLRKDPSNRTWSKDLCDKRSCEPAGLGMKPRSKKDLDVKRHHYLDDDNTIMRYGSDCDIWKHTDPMEWAYVGFDTTCIERTRRVVPKNDWPEGLPYMFLSWTACTSNMLSDTKLPDGTVGGLYHVKIRCTWYQMVVETFLILDLIFTVPMMVIMYYFIANRCADNLEVEQQFAPVDDSSDSSEEFQPEAPDRHEHQRQHSERPPSQSGSETQGVLEASSSA